MLTAEMHQKHHQQQQQEHHYGGIHTTRGHHFGLVKVEEDEESDYQLSIALG